MEAEAKTEVVEKVDENQKMDDVLDNFEKETQESTSDSKETTGKETVETKESEGTDLDKKSDSKEETEDIPKEFHKNPAWQRILKERDEAKSKLTELETKGSISDEDRKILDDAKTITTSREGIETLMRAQGFKDEAISKRLSEAGFDVGSPEGDISLICKELDMDEKALKPAQRNDIEDFSKIARIIFKDAMGKTLSQELKPIQEHIGKQTQKESANTITDSMQATVKEDGILDWDKDVEPELNKFLDANPEATQESVLAHFKELNHKLTVGRLKTSKKQEVRDVKKNELRQNGKGQLNLQQVPKKTGNFHQDADALLDHIGASD